MSKKPAWTGITLSTEDRRAAHTDGLCRRSPWRAYPKSLVFDWEGFWLRMSRTPASALTREDLDDALFFWMHLPYFLALASPGAGWAMVTVDGFGCFSLLSTAAEARGLDSAPLSRAAPVFMRLADGPFRKDSAGGPFHKALASRAPWHPLNWPSLPQCADVFVGKPRLSAKDRRICQAAEDVVNRLAARLKLEKASTAPSVPATGPAGTVRRAKEFIEANPGARAKDIAKHCEIEPTSFTNHVAPRLKLLGFTSGRGCCGGYYPPKPESQQSQR